MNQFTESASSLGRPGIHDVAEFNMLEFEDPRRGKRVAISVQVPREEGRYPLVLFSHGIGVSAESTWNLTRFWATHGYACIYPEHDDSPRVRQRDGLPEVWHGGEKRLGRLNEVLQSPGTIPGRVADFVSILDCLPQVEALTPELAGKLDPTRVGTAGHSFGACIAQVAAGATTLVLGKKEPVCFGDPRISAVLQLATQASSGRFGLTRESWKDFTVPMMIMNADSDPVSPDVRSDWMKEPFQRSRPGHKYLAILRGGNHSALACIDFDEGFDMWRDEQAARNRPVPPFLRELVRMKNFGRYEQYLKAVKAMTLTYWDKVLREDPAGSNPLDSSAIGAELDRMFELHSR